MVFISSAVTFKTDIDHWMTKFFIASNLKIQTRNKLWKNMFDMVRCRKIEGKKEGAEEREREIES